MKHYFEFTYPRRLADLKKELEPLATTAARSKDEEIAKAAVMEFQRKISLFAENTKLHLTQTVPHLAYLERVFPKYIAEQMGKDTTIYLIMKLIHKFE
uniref:Uncharacterized protein n=1 Tax=viral metagenome TaxID=1070528 RepID=A0A6M3K5L5_9ZZZZ